MPRLSVGVEEVESFLGGGTGEGEGEGRREDEVAKTGYGSIQVSGPEPVHVFYENIEHDLKPFSSKNSKPRGK